MKKGYILLINILSVVILTILISLYLYLNLNNLRGTIFLSMVFAIGSITIMIFSPDGNMIKGLGQLSILDLAVIAAVVLGSFFMIFEPHYPDLFMRGVICFSMSAGFLAFASVIEALKRSFRK
jgi:hypothetical protein